MTGKVLIETKLDESGIDKGQKSINQKLSGLKGTASGITSSMAKVAGAAFAAMGVAGATAFVKMGIESAATAAAVEAQWGQVFAGIEGPAMETLNALSKEFGVLPERLKPAMTAFESYFKTSMNPEDALDATTRAMTIAGDGAAFYDKSLEDTSASLKSFMLGNLDAGDAIGVNTNVTKIAKAYNDKYGGSFEDLNDAQKQNYLLEYVEGIYAANGAMGQGARESESYSNVLGNLKQAWENFMAIVGKPFMEVAIKGMQVLSGWLVIAGNAVQTAYDKFSAFFQGLKNGEGVFGGIVTGVKNMVDAIKGAFSGGNFADVGAIAGNIIPLIINILLGGIPRLLQMGADLLNKLAEGMGMSIPELVAMVLTIVTNFITSFIGALPMIIDTGLQLLMGLIQGITTALPQLIVAVQSILQTFLTTIVTQLPMILSMGVEVLMTLINGVVSMLPALIPMAVSILLMLVDTLIGNIGMIINAGIQLLNGVVDGIVQSLPTLISAAITLVMALFDGIIQNLPTILNAGVELLIAVVDGVLSMLPELGSAALEIVSTIWDAIKEVDWLSIGSDIIAGIASGISAAGSALWDAAKGILGSFEQNVKDFFGIKSPSRLMRDQVGKYIPQGIAVGMEDEEDTLLKASTSMSATVMAGLKGIKQPNIARVASAAYGSGSVTNTTTKTNTITQNVYVNESLSERELQKRLRIEAQKLGYGVI